MTLDRAARSLAVLAACALPAAAPAQGFGLNEIGTCAIGRGFALTGRPCEDGSAIYWNPAATTALRGTTVYAGIAAIAVGGDFTSDTTGRMDEGDVPVEFPPHLFINYKGPNQRWAAGLGVYVPYGLTSQWHDDFAGRFSALKASLATLYAQPNVAFEVVPERFSVGVGAVIGRSDVELIQGIDLADAPAGPGLTFGMLGVSRGTEFARATLEGDAMAYGFHVGVHAQITPAFSAGARYLSELTFEYDEAEATFSQVSTELVLAYPLPVSATDTIPAGTPYDAIVAPQFQSGGALVSQSVVTEISHPAQFQVGLAYTGFQRTILSLDYTWIGWSAFEELPVNFELAPDRVLIEDYDDSWSVRSGIQYGFANGWAGRAGFSFVSTPAPEETVTPLLPDQDRFNYNLGVGIPFGGRYMLDLGYLRVDTEGRRGRIAERTSREQTAEDLNTGFYRLDANIFSLSLKAQF